jgi:hypothetical protein
MDLSSVPYHVIINYNVLSYEILQEDSPHPAFMHFHSNTADKYGCLSTCQSLSDIQRLARELRDEVCAYYLHKDDGYIYIPDTNRLRCANGRPIEFSFMYTCKKFASKMRGLALQVITVGFRTHFDNSEPRTIDGDDEWLARSRAG